MFKIRKKIFPEPGYEICEKKYQDFLVSKKDFLSEDLFMLFQFDHFHDGSLKNIRYCYKKGYIEMTLISPNFLDEKNKCNFTCDKRLSEKNVVSSLKSCPFFLSLHRLTYLSNKGDTNVYKIMK